MATAPGLLPTSPADDLTGGQSVDAARRLLRAAATAEAEAEQAVMAADLSAVTRVVAVVASSRGGSSLMYQLLADQSGVLSIAGEHTALYKLGGLDRGTDGSDALAKDVAFDWHQLSRDFLAFTGFAADDDPDPAVDPGSYAVAVARRLALQWPLEEIEFPTVRAAVELALRSCSAPGDPERLFLSVLGYLRQVHPRIDPAYYDLPCATRGTPTRDDFGPPNDGYCVEEPPFVVPRLRRRPTRRQLAEGVLVLKSSVDAYRLHILRRMMPNAEIRVIHLSRNPAASVNGLYDGWRDRGFFSYDVSDRHTLSISGYSELGPAARRWWNFDIPPGWEKLVDGPLERVCAHQWAGAHRAILDGLGPATADKVLRLPFERILDPSTRERTLLDVCDFAGITEPARGGALPVVMATAPPRPGRWRQRAELVLPAVGEPDVREVAAELGYGSRHDTTWV